MLRYEDIVKADNPVGYWRLGELSGVRAYDISGSAHHGTLSGVTVDQAGAVSFNRSMLFDGTDDKIDIGDQSTYNFERTDAFSLEAWVKTDTAVNHAVLSKMSNNAPNTGYDLFMLSTGELVAHLINTWDTNALRVTTAGQFNDNEWHHVAVTYDGSSAASGLSVYVDGAAESLTIDVDTLSASIQNSNPVLIGARDGGAFFDGYIDEVAIYNVELSAAQVLDHYNASAMPTGIVNKKLIEVYPTWFIDGSVSAPQDLKLSSSTVGVSESDTSFTDILATLTITAKQVNSYGNVILAARAKAGTGTGTIRRIGIFTPGGDLWAEAEVSWTKGAGDDWDLEFFMDILH